MKFLPQAAVDELQGRAPILAGAYRLALPPPSGPQRVWSGYGEISIEDEIYQGIGSHSLLTPISSQVGGAADGMTLTLSGLDPEVAKTIQDENYHQRPVTIWRLIFSADAVTLLAGAVFMRGKLDYVVIRETAGGDAALDFIIEGPRRDMSRAGARIRSDTDQRLLGGSADGSMKHISTAGRKTLKWGQKPDRPWAGRVGDIVDRARERIR